MTSTALDFQLSSKTGKDFTSHDRLKSLRKNNSSVRRMHVIQVDRSPEIFDRISFLKQIFVSSMHKPFRICM